LKTNDKITQVANPLFTHCHTVRPHCHTVRRNSK